MDNNGVDGEVEREEVKDNYSVWVLQKIQKINKMLGMTFEGIGDRMLHIFVEIERRREKKIGGTLVIKEKRKQEKGGCRE